MADNETISYIPPDELWRRAAAVLHRKLPGLQAVSERADIARCRNRGRT